VGLTGSSVRCWSVLPTRRAVDDGVTQSPVRPAAAWPAAVLSDCCSPNVLLTDRRVAKLSGNPRRSLLLSLFVRWRIRRLRELFGNRDALHVEDALVEDAAAVVLDCCRDVAVEEVERAISPDQRFRRRPASVLILGRPSYR